MRKSSLLNKRRISDLSSGDPNRGHVTLWILRILVDLNVCGRARRSAWEELLSRRLGIATELDGEPRSNRDVQAELRAMHNRAEAREWTAFPSRGPVARNVRWLASALGLSEVEQAMLAFIGIMHEDSDLAEAVEGLGEVSPQQCIRLLSTVLGIRRADVARALSDDGMLMRSGFLKFDLGGSYSFRNKLECGRGIRDALVQSRRNGARILDEFFRAAPAPMTRPEDFAHVQEDYQFLRGYLAQVMKRRRRCGVNVLIHGRPGTGKTEMVRTLCQELGVRLNEVAISQGDGSPLDRGDRLSAYQLAQTMLASGGQNAILFDEIEDVFPTPNLFFGMSPKDTQYKAWINRTLEENPVPSFWVSNNISQLDNAYLRRFDYIMEFRAPNRAARKRMVRRYTDSFDVSPGLVEQLAGNQNIVPAYIQRAAKVAKCIAGAEGISAERAMAQVIDRVLDATGERSSLLGAGRELRYDPGLINASSDPERLVAGITSQGRGRICLYGPPGTGKTAFAQYIAERAGRQVLVKRASDLLGKYVGESERNIAETFREARAEDAVLVLDEADSFLRDRRGAQRAWEVTQVNELLVQMENFDGIFVASTNLMDHLDAAALRRFDFKIHFDYLRPDQRLALFEDVLANAGWAQAADLSLWKDRLHRLDTLTPGDFAVAVRQLSTLGWQPDPGRLYEVLEAECRAKPGAKRGPMGFVA
jgi:transitional endoplasmic reticulum ATPase